VRYGWKEVGPLIALPAATVGGGAAGTPPTLQPPDGTPFPADEVGMKVLVEDANGHGAAAAIDTTTSVSLAPPVPVLVPPLRVLTNLLPVSRGKMVANEVLGSGNALAAGQDFVLQKSPVTYMPSANSTSGDGYASTVRVWVNGLEWSEVRGFYSQPPGAQVFVTREDGQGKTHVVFGDGQNGARLPTGVNNVVASYRYGSGAEAPPAGSLTVVLNPQPGLRAVRNPVAVGGGSDPDAPDKVRRLAPRSLLTFNRAVSVDDFEAIAAGAPGVVRAKAAVALGPQAQRPAVTVWVGDDAKAVSNARTALTDAAGTDRAPRVVAARAVVMTLSLTVVVDPRRDPTAVLAAVRAALIDPDAGLLGVNVVGIGQSFYDSQVYAACLAVPGVVAVRGLRFTVTNLFLEAALVRDRRYVREILLRRPPIDVPELPTLLIWTVPRSPSGERHDPGAGAFLFLPDDARHLVLTPGVAP
jgi:predicted phage baseplate assembly protein